MIYPIESDKRGVKKMEFSKVIPWAARKKMTKWFTSEKEADIFRDKTNGYTYQLGSSWAVEYWQ